MHYPPRAFGTYLCAAICLLCSLSLGSCGGAAPRPDEAELSRGFARMQVHEANQETAGSRAADDTLPCPHRCKQANHSCDEGDHICHIASELSDPDGAQRCEQSRMACRSARAQAASGCDCK